MTRETTKPIWAVGLAIQIGWTVRAILYYRHNPKG